MKIKKAFSITIFSLIMILFSCEEFKLVTCDNCQYAEPSTANLQISFESGPAAGMIHDITVYQGKIEDGIVIEQFSSRNSTRVTVNLNTEYTVTASVTIEGKDYIIVDSAVPRSKIYSGCEEICYYIVDNKINLNLKN